MGTTYKTIMAANGSKYRAGPASRQALAVISANPGINTAELNREVWGGPGHSATYDTVDRLIRAGLVETGPPRSGRGDGLYVVKGR